MLDREATAGPSGRATDRGWGWFLGWLALGACAAVGLAAVVTAGLALVLLAAAAAGLLLRKGPRNATAGLLSGTALPLLYIAYLNRSGPGTVCSTVPGSQTCTDEYTPIPFLIAGVLLLCAGFLIFTTLNRGSRSVGGTDRPER
ncbi:hypothetical protein ACFY2J_15485 [Streptomyces collinus]|uniref:hypothetical protein n=1 Tax=Streptomyces collinus TaxID=42684 RepID=UPI0036B1714D